MEVTDVTELTKVTERTAVEMLHPLPSASVQADLQRSMTKLTEVTEVMVLTKLTVAKTLH